VRVFVRVGSVVKASKPATGRRFLFSIDLPPRDVTVRVVAEDAAGYRASSRVGPVYGLPRAGRPRAFGRSVEDGPLARRVERLARAYGGIAAVFVQDLQSGRGAAWNARARFPAASTVKLAIAIETLRRLSDRPTPGSDLYRLLWSMLVYSDNAAANALLTWIGGSTSGGAAQVNATLQRLGIVDTLMYGGYSVTTAAVRAIPLRVEEQPAFGIGKHTTAWDLARLHGAVHAATVGRGRLPDLRGSFGRRDARFLLWILAHVADEGKIDRFLPEGVPVPHKAGWVSTARHDAGLVYWRGGSYVVAVMTWNANGAGSSADVLAGRVAASARARFRQLSRDERSPPSRDSSARST
jgi:beta-lactamase class A